MRNLLISLSLIVVSNFLLPGSLKAQELFVPPTPRSAITKFAQRKPTMKEFIIPDIPKFPGSTFLSGEEKKIKDSHPLLIQPITVFLKTLNHK